jgi:hypothetical protein
MIPTVIAAVLILLFQLVTPHWWWIMVVPFGVALSRPMSAWGAFRMGILSAGIVWLVASGGLFLTTSQIIASRIALMLNVGSGWMVLFATVGVAMIAGGVAGAAGQAVRERFSRIL